jgi:hypothetical protein
MDVRCPRKLEELPTEFCPLAVLRLKQLRNSSEELTEEEESKLVGCPWAVSHQLSCYCFFKYAAEYIHDVPSDKEIAHMNSVSLETVKDVTKSAIDKIKDIKSIKDIDDE